MNDAPSLNSLERAEKLQGMGCKRKRVEDVRFTQGRGNYVDDIKLPGMLHGDFHRSSHAHARIVKIDTSKAKAVPGVVAVLTAEDLKGVNLAWMPTLAGDVQMVLADGKVLFQNQEIAFVVATDRYVAADAADLVEVEYEALPVVVDPFKAMNPDAPILREDIKDKKDGAHGPRNHPNHIFNWQVGDRELTDAAFVKAEVKTKDLLSYQRVHPCPLETCQCVVSFNKITGDLTIYGTFQAPHVIRTVVALISSIPEQKIHVISPDIGGGFGNKVGAYSGYICAAVASIVTGLPVKWVEDRIENLSTTSFARDYHMTTEIAATREGRVTGLRVHILADHGAFDACADPSKWPAGFANIVTGSYDFPVAHLSVDGVYTNKAPGGVAYRCSFRVTEVAYAIERAMDIMAQKLGLDPVDFRVKNFIKREQFPYNSALGWEYDSGDYHTAMQKALDATDYRKLREEQKAKQERSSAARRVSSWASASPSSLRSSARAPRRTATFSALRCSIPARSASIRPARASRGWARRARARAMRRPGLRSSRPRSAFPPTTSWSRKATPTPRLMASAPTARAQLQLLAQRSPWPRAR